MEVCNKFIKISQWLEEVEKNVKNLCIIPKNAIDVLFNEAGYTPARLRLCAADGTNRANAFFCKTFACTPLYFRAIFAALS
jgi:hypothetical protein